MSKNTTKTETANPRTAEARDIPCSVCGRGVYTSDPASEAECADCGIDRLESEAAARDRWDPMDF